MRRLSPERYHYVWSLGGAEPAPRPRSRVFHDYRRCHFDPSGAGDVIAARVIGTDSAVADSTARSAGGYRVPSLHRVSERSQLTHEGWPLTLAELMEPSRAATYAGHEYGFELSDGERAALVHELSPP